MQSLSFPIISVSLHGQRWADFSALVYVEVCNTYVLLLPLKSTKHMDLKFLTFCFVSLCRYYSTLLQTLQACDEQTVASVRAGLVARLGPDMETFLQLVQNKPCTTGSGSSAYNNPSSWRNMPVFNIQPGFRGRDPTHLFAKRSAEDVEGAAEN